MSILFGFLAIVGGLLAGAIFYGGLWWTTRRIPHADNPVQLMIGSWLLRLPLTMGVFYGVMKITGSLLYLGIALVVFFAVRTGMIGLLRPRGDTGVKKEKPYAVKS